MKKIITIVAILLVVICNIGIYAIQTSGTNHLPIRNKYSDMVDAAVLLRKEGGFFSGVFIANNVILTAAHCLRDRLPITVGLSTGKILEPTNFYVEPGSDISFILVDTNEPHIATISDSEIALGETVFLVGTPYCRELKFSLLKGIISYRGRLFPNINQNRLLQADVDGGKGCSGGPLYNENGNLIGMYVGQTGNGGLSLSFFESNKSILEAYRRFKNASD